jgi:hypothetical protein
MFLAADFKAAKLYQSRNFFIQTNLTRLATAGSMSELMKAFSTICQVLSAVTAFAAAWFWLRSAQGEAPRATYDAIDDLKPRLDEAASKNRIAAVYAGISATFAGIGTLAGLF